VDAELAAGRDHPGGGEDAVELGPPPAAIPAQRHAFHAGMTTIIGIAPSGSAARGDS
jgi:hypothetical protein